MTTTTKNRKKKYKQVVKKLDASKFKPCSKGRITFTNIDKAVTVLTENLWSMFKTPSKENLRKMTESQKGATFGCSVMDYAWTESVRTAFYDHPYNKTVVDKMKKSQAFGWWALNSEPMTIYEHD